MCLLRAGDDSGITEAPACTQMADPSSSSADDLMRRFANLSSSSDRPGYASVPDAEPIAGIGDPPPVLPNSVPPGEASWPPPPPAPDWESDESLLRRWASEAVQADRAENFPAALAAYQKAVTVAGRLSEVHSESAGLLNALRSYQDRVAKLEVLVEVEPTSPPAPDANDVESTVPPPPHQDNGVMEAALQQSRTWAMAAVEADTGSRYEEAILAYRTTIRHLGEAIENMDHSQRGPIEMRHRDYSARLAELEEAQRVDRELQEAEAESQKAIEREALEAEANERVRDNIAHSGATDAFICPISCEIMEDPVVCADGHTYERSEIEGWLANHNTSPKTNEVLESTALVPNHNIRAAIGEWRQLQLLRRSSEYGV